MQGNKRKEEVGRGNVKGLDSVSGIEKSGEKGFGRIGLFGDGSGGKVGFNGDGVSLIAEVCGSMRKIEAKGGRDLDKKVGCGGNGAALGVNGGKVDDMDIDMSDMSEKKGGDGEDLSDSEHQYSVGDFVWGKIKHHPWWPGQIYDPSDASDYAVKYMHRDRYLVAYFGDGTFAWCYPSQLKPFEENFEQMSRQSNSKNFVSAVEGALDELGRLLELEMTCSCIPEENWSGIARPMAVNAGIKEGTFVPEIGITRFSIAPFEPEEFLAELRFTAQAISVTSMLELTAMKSRLSALYRARGGYQMPMYHAPQHIVGLEDNIKTGVMNNGEVGGQLQVPVQGPVEDWLSSPVSPSFKKTNRIARRLLISEDKVHQRRKQKSIAEIMGSDPDVVSKSKEDMDKEGTHSGKLPATSRRKKKKATDEVESRGGDNVTSPSGSRKKIKHSGTPITMAENKVSGAENDDDEGKEETKKGPVSRKKKNDSSSVENGSMVKEEARREIASRERKKSKYLSPPFTNINRGRSDSSSKRDTKAESQEGSDVAARVGTHVSGADGPVMGSPAILKGSSKTYPKKHLSELGIKHDTSGGSSPQTPKQDQNKIVDHMVTKASSNQVLSEIRSAALDILYVKETKSVDMIQGFFSTFRSSTFRNGSNYKNYNKRTPGRKRKSLDSEPGPIGKDLNQTDQSLPDRKSARTRAKKNEAKSDTPKPKQATGSSSRKTNTKKTGGKTSSAALILTFSPGVSVPSKDDLIATYSKFGSVNESETEVFHDSSCAQVVFVRNSDAEQAFNHSRRMIKSSGDARISYRLRYPSDASKTRKLSENLHPKASLPKKGGKTQEVSPLQFVRQKLEMMTSMLEKSDVTMSQEMKSNLESEMKGLLEKVRTIAESSST